MWDFLEGAFTEYFVSCLGIVDRGVNGICLFLYFVELLVDEFGDESW